MLKNVLIGGLFLLAAFIGYSIYKASGETTTTSTTGGGSVSTSSGGLLGSLAKFIPQNLHLSIA